MNRKKYVTCAGCRIVYHPKEARKSNKYCTRSCAIRYRKPHSLGFNNGGSFKSGQDPWNKGMTGYRLGHDVSAQTKDKMRLANLGENAPNWKGGVSSKNELLRHSHKWSDWRRVVYERDNFTCQDCGAKSCAGNRVTLHPHHIRAVSQYPELVYDMSNGITLCKPCHIKRHTGKKAGLL